MPATMRGTAKHRTQNGTCSGSVSVLMPVICGCIVCLARQMLVLVFLLGPRTVIVVVDMPVQMRMTVRGPVRVRVRMVVSVLVGVRMHAAS